MFGRNKKVSMVAPADALPGRAEAIPLAAAHAVSGNPIAPPFPDDCEQALVAMGCFWGAERAFWQLGGVFSTAVGYTAGFTPNPTYEEVCSGLTGHTEAVLVVFDARQIGFADIMRVFWEGHDPTQGMRQGNDVGTQYRSGVYTYSDAQREVAEATRTTFSASLSDNGFGPITTEIVPASEFYYAEDYHQQYLAKNPGGYCGLGGTGARLAV